MKKKFKVDTIIPILLILFPYIFFLLCIFLDSDFGSYLFYLYIILAILVNCTNIIYACTRKKEEYNKLAFYNMIIKLSHILFYFINFCIGIISMLLCIHPILIGAGVFVIIFCIIIDLLLMLTSSMYGINALIRARKIKKIGNVFLTVNIILHIIFVLDVVSSIITFVKLKKMSYKKEKSVDIF